MSHILVVEDEMHLAEGLRFNLEAEGHTADLCSDGESALQRLVHKHEPFDAVVLDVMLPGIDGFAVASALRKEKNYVPVLILTARSRPEDVLEGFAAGADDYLAKPFDLQIFLARLQGLLRRTAWMAGPLKASGAEAGANSVAATPGSATAEQESEEVYSFEGKTLDFERLELRVGKNTTHLTLMEAKLLRHLIRNAGRVVARKAILEDVWDLREDTDTRAIDNFIVRLRRYLEDDPGKPRHLLTVRGVGYKFIA